jgi:hypothetical protein
MMKQETRDDLGLVIDMLDADRLRDWAEKLDIYGNDISHWSDRSFVVKKLRDIAGRLEDTVREVGTLRELAGIQTDGASEERPAGETPEAQADIWTMDQVAALNAKQVDLGRMSAMNRVHPYTCPNRANHPEFWGDAGVLVATIRGWMCPCCDYTQKWAHGVPPKAQPSPASPDPIASAPAETQEERADDPWPHPCRSCGGFGGHESGCPGDTASIPAQVERLSHRIERVAFWLGEALSFISRLDLDTATRLSIKELRDALAEAQPSSETPAKETR